MKTKYNPDTIRRYAQAGYTASSLAGILKVSRQRASQILHACGVKPLTHPPLAYKGENSRLRRKEC